MSSLITFLFLYLYYARHLLTSFLLHFSQAIVSVKISNLLICFCSFVSSCPKLETDFMEHLYIVLHCLIK